MSSHPNDRTVLRSRHAVIGGWGTGRSPVGYYAHSW